MKAEDFDKASIEELQALADQCFAMAKSPLQEPQITGTGAHLYIPDLDDAGKLRLLLEAQFYLTAVARKRDDIVAKRDRKLEIWVIVLIGVEILLSVGGILIGVKEGNSQARVLSNIERGTRESADAMSAAKTSLETQVKILQEEYALRQSDIAEQRRKPVVELRVMESTKSGSRYTIIPANAIPPISYASSPAPNNPTGSLVNFYFALRNVGTAPIKNFSVVPLVPQAFQIECTDYSPIHLLGQEPDECTAPVGRTPPIEPLLKNTPPPSPQRGNPDFEFRVQVYVPNRLARFDFAVMLAGDNMNPVYHRFQARPVNTLP
jgi:hypothetical protein